MPTTEDAVLTRLTTLAARADAILVSDYGYGTVTPRVFERVKAVARRANAIVTVDSRYQLPRFTGTTAATPNEAELEQLTGMPVDDELAVEKAGRQLLERLDARMLLVTRGSRGMALLERDGATTFIPIHGTDEIADVTGAGDTVISTFTLALACGTSPFEAASLANIAGGHVVIFEEDTADRLIASLRPDVHAKGTDYLAGAVPEEPTVRSVGGRVALVGDPKDHSTRDLITRIVERFR